MCAWLTTAASIVFGSKEKVLFRSVDSARGPWNMPHSTISCVPFTDRTWREPVVVWAAP